MSIRRALMLALGMAACRSATTAPRSSDAVHPTAATPVARPPGAEAVTRAPPPASPEPDSDAFRTVRTRFLDEQGEPVVGAPFVLTVGTWRITGRSDATGRVVVKVPREHGTEAMLRVTIDGRDVAWPIRIRGD